MSISLIILFRIVFLVREIVVVRSSRVFMKVDNKVMLWECVLGGVADEQVYMGPCDIM
jgi:hypothetical protein